MPPLSLEQRVAALQQEISELKSRRTDGREKDWRRTIGMFTDNPGMRRAFRRGHETPRGRPQQGAPTAAEKATRPIMILLDAGHSTRKRSSGRDDLPSFPSGAWERAF